MLLFLVAISILLLCRMGRVVIFMRLSCVHMWHVYQMSVFSDNEFGHVDTPPSAADCHWSETQWKTLSQSPEKLNHLNQRCELLELLDRYAECFSDSSDVVCHEIKLKPDFVPNQSKAYRIPEILKPEVERQLDQLVRDGFLVPSKSPNSSLILCVLKSNNQIRIVCDFRYVNSFTVPDAYLSNAKHWWGDR